jgi:hypothetical protein
MAEIELVLINPTVIARIVPNRPTVAIFFINWVFPRLRFMHSGILFEQMIPLWLY